MHNEGALKTIRENNVYLENLEIFILGLGTKIHDLFQIQDFRLVNL